MLDKKLLPASRLCRLEEMGEQKWLGYLSQSPQKQESFASTPQHPCPLVAALLVACGWDVSFEEEPGDGGGRRDLCSARKIISINPT